ncbi:recombinase family protein [Nocardioides soli]|uniref:DNA invertase Pin-like site-specific DNA recombinase n=1 Tax=Nocardioides soli TaxID=1036020 RepID=A0A7W4VT96_9ACTN|nr:recombinase family protein [Nocardioides soli]MBB3041380.1 DNA invertase Pin-like site-specific DNA recombinase [Nocardioides soli]
MTDRGRAVIYTRISRDEEGNRVGVERQEADCRDLAKRLGLDVAHVYTDNDIGASSLSKKARPAYAAMLAAVRAGEVSTVLSYSNSRLTRRPAEWIDLITLANKGKLQIRTVVSGTYDLGTADGRAVAITVAAWDGAEAERIGERLEAAHRHLALRGEPFTGGRRAFGWKEDRRTIEPQEAELIREAVERVKAGWGVNTIARDWNERGIRTPWGGEWKFNNLHEVLTRPRTAGLRTLKKELVRDADGNVVKGKWQPIITTEEREEVLALLAARARPRRRRGKYLLGSLLRCGDCGAKMWGNLLRARNSTNYQCARGGHLAISGKRLEEAVMALVEIPQGRSSKFPTLGGCHCSGRRVPVAA